MSRTGRLLRGIVRLSCARPAVTVLLAVLLAALSVWYALTTLTLATSTRALLPRSQPYIQRWVQLSGEFGGLDDLVIAVEAPTLPEGKVYANRLVQAIRERQVPLRRIAYRIDPEQFEGRQLLFLPKETLLDIRDRIFDYQGFVEGFAARPTLDRFVDGLATQVAQAFVTGFFDLGLEERKGEGDIRFIEDLVQQIAGRVDRSAPYRSPWGSLFVVDDRSSADKGYFVSGNRRLLFILGDPESEQGSFVRNQRAIQGVRAAIGALRAEFPSVEVGVTGKPALSNDEMAAAFRDSELATVLAFALTLLLLVIAFLALKKPVVMLVVLTLALCWSIGIATLAVGHLSLFSVMFISIVIGIGIDYGIYYLFRYEEELFLGRSLREAIEITAARAGPGMLLGAVTAAGTFYVLMLTDFPGLQELGFIAGSAIVLSWVAMITVFPATLVLLDRRHADRPPREVPRTLALERVHVPLVDRLAAYPKTVLALAAAMTLASVWELQGVRFDYNLLNLQAEGTESVIWEKRILSTAHRSGFSALSSADSLEELRRRHETFEGLASVSEVDSAARFFPEDQAEKVKIIGDFAPLVADLRIYRPMGVDLSRLLDALETLKRRITILATEAPEGKTKTRLERLSDALVRLIIKIRQTSPPVAGAALAHLQRQLYADFVESFQRLQANAAPQPLGLKDVPVELRRKFISPAGRFLLQIHPAVDIWDRDGATRFVEELRAVDPDVTGTAVIAHEAIRLMERGSRQGALYAIVLVAGITALTIRRWRETLLALLPLALGMTWTVGFMVFFGHRFTMGNVFALPLLLGAAAEYGVNVVIRFMEGRDHGGPLVARSTMMAVLVNGLTTIVGFGSLMLADHRGIFGLGFLLTLGSVLILIASLVVLPVLLSMVQRMREARAGRRTAPGVPEPAAHA